jgi:hypothetical protein
MVKKVLTARYARFSWRAGSDARGGRWPRSQGLSCNPREAVKVSLASRISALPQVLGICSRGIIRGSIRPGRSRDADSQNDGGDEDGNHKTQDAAESEQAHYAESETCANEPSEHDPEQTPS